MHYREFTDEPSEQIALLPFGIDIVAASYLRYGETALFIQSLINQSCHNWKLYLIHDGYDASFYQLKKEFAEDMYRIRLMHTEKRYNDYGHSLRDVGLNVTTAEYVLVTNSDNYYLPSFLSYACLAIGASKPDALIFDMVHGHTNPGGRRQLAHCFFNTVYELDSIDIGAAVVKGSLAREVGFKGRHFAADWQYLSDVRHAAGPAFNITKIPRCLLVHN